jgi:2-methylcitrate dehydratase
MTQAEQMADFVVRACYDDLSESVRHQLKIRVLDALGCAIGAADSAIAGPIRTHIEEFGGAGLCTLMGGGRTAPDRAAFYNGALIRYLDFNDSYLAPGKTCRPSDNLGPILAACEYAGGSGRNFLTALAIAYQVQCRLGDVAPVRDKGFDHTMQGSFAVAAGVSKGLGLDAQRTAHALAICGTAFNALPVCATLTGPNRENRCPRTTAQGASQACERIQRAFPQGDALPDHSTTEKWARGFERETKLRRVSQPPDVLGCRRREVSDAQRAAYDRSAAAANCRCGGRY